MNDTENTALPARGPQRPGLLLVGHGTRDRRGVAECLALGERVAELLPGIAVRTGFLELARPAIDEAMGELRAEQVDALCVVPLLLFAAGHAKEDIPAAVAASCAGSAVIPRVQAAPLGTHPALVALSARRYEEAVAPLAPLPAEDSLLLLVGRGSRDRGAREEMFAFARLRQQLSGLPHVATAFYAMAEPGLEATLTELQGAPWRRVVVQPHLLFSGQILDRLNALVVEVNRQRSDQEWVVCRHLGPSSDLAVVLVERFRQALRPLQQLN